MKHITVTLVLLAFGIQIMLKAQNQEPEENPITTDYSIDKFTNEPDAPAIVIFDKADTRFLLNDNDYTYIFKRKVRIKILSEAGLKFAEVEIPTYNSNYVSETIIDMSASSYNFSQNRFTKKNLDIANSHKEKKSNTVEITKFAIPNAQVGSIIEYEYKLESNYLFNIPDWNFQWEIPVIYSGYTLHMVPFYNYQYRLQGALKFDVYHTQASNDKRSLSGIEYSDLIYTFGMKNIPSFKNEGFITSTSDYIMKIDFQLAQILYPSGRKQDVISTWPLLKKDLLTDEDFGRFVKLAQKQAPKIVDINDLINTEPIARIDSVLSYVKRNFIWNGNFRLKTDQKFQKFITSKRGSSSEINLFTIGLLNAVGIKTSPAIISTRGHGKIRTTYPFYDNFNNVIIVCETPEGLLLRDATNILVSNDRLPPECLNELGLLINDNKEEEWIQTNSIGMSRIRTSISTIFENNMQKSRVSVTGTEYDGLFLREKYGTDMEKILKHISGENDEVVDSSLIIKNMENAKSPYILNYVVSNKTQQAGESVYIQPFFREIISENPFKLASRKYPIDLGYPQRREFISTITIPDGYKLELIPSDKSSQKNSLFEYFYKIKQIDNQIQVVFNYTLFNQIYQPDNYLLLKSFFREVVEIGNERIVLKTIL